MTPGLDWRAEYGAWPVARAKLSYCEREMAGLGDREPEVTDDELDDEFPPVFDGAIRAIVEDLARGSGDNGSALLPAAGPFPRLERDGRMVYQAQHVLDVAASGVDAAIAEVTR